ncbi:DMT family transporter [bacterium]|nr:DMT family transporter [bacterium]
MVEDGRPSNKTLFVALVISVLSISSAATLIRLANAPALVVAAARMMMASGLLWVMAPWTKCYKIKEAQWKSIIGAGFFLALHFGFWITSLETTSVASSLVLVTMNPIVVALGSTFILKEPPGKSLIFGTVISISGCAVIVIGEGFLFSNSLKGNLFALGGAFAMSCYMMIGRRAASRGNFFSYITWVYTVAGIFLCIVVSATGQSLLNISPTSYLFMFIIALIPQFIGHSLINWSLKYLHASYLAAAILVEPLAGTLIAYIILGENFSVFSCLGGVLILLGVAMAFRYRGKISGS